VLYAGTGRAPGVPVRGSRLGASVPRRKAGGRPMKVGRKGKRKTRPIDIHNATRPPGTPPRRETDPRAIEVDALELMNDAWAGATDAQLALKYKMSPDTLADRMGELLKRARAAGDIDILHAQMTLATGIVTKFFRGKRSRLDTGVMKYVGQMRLKQTNARNEPVEGTREIHVIVHDE
jgi:hypothetical protein